MRICITGARGRLGLALRHYFTNRAEVLALSRNADAAHDALSALPAVIGEAAVDVIIDLAWGTVPSIAERNPGVEWTDDLPRLSQTLGALARQVQQQKPAPLLVFFSTCAVYGELKENGSAFNESGLKNPIGWYAKAKSDAEDLIQRFSRTLGVQSLILRVSNPYGFDQSEHSMQGVIPALVRSAMDGKPFNLWGSGSALKDYLHVQDLCVAVEEAICSGYRGVLNVASGRSIALSEVMTQIEKLTGQRINTVEGNPRPWDVKNGRYSINKIHEVTGWQPEYSFENGLESFVKRIFNGGRN